MNRRPSRTASATLAVALAVTACDPTAEAGRAQPPPVGKAADFAEVLRPGLSFELGGTAPTGGAGVLISPHYTVLFRSILITDRVDADLDRYLGLGNATGTRAAVRAADGHEFVIVQLTNDPDAMTGRWTDSTTRLPVTKGVGVALKIGERTVPVTKLPEANDVIAVSVPKGGAASLRLTDERVTQSISLRDGKRGADAHPGFYRNRHQRLGTTYQQAGAVNFRGWVRAVKVTIKIESAFVEPWAPGRGWAKPGRAWLWLGGVTVVADGVTGYDARRPRSYPIDFKLDVPRTFTLTAAGGRRTRAAPAAPRETYLGDVLGSFGVAFDVPAGFAGGTVTVAPQGPMVGLFKDVKPKLRWARPPDPQRITISIKP